ncbi:Zinc finger and SCAN domain-containing protein 4, partial [Galemys pyrenaicus]
METGQDEGQENSNSSLIACPINDSITSQSREILSLVIVKEENYPRPKEGAVSLENPLSSRRAGLGTSRKGPCKDPPFTECPERSLDQGIPEPVPFHQGIEWLSMSRRQQEMFLKHKRIHEQEKPFTCSRCKMSFSQKLTLHEEIHVVAKEKHFRCLSARQVTTSHEPNHSHLRTHQIVPSVFLKHTVSLATIP